MRAAWLIVPSLLILGACGDPLADIERVTDDTFIPDTGVATALPTQAELEREDSVLSGRFRNREEPEVAVEPEATLEGDAGSVDVKSATTGEPAPGRKGMLGWLRRATVEEQVTAAALVEQSAVVGTETADGANSVAAGEQVAALTPDTASSASGTKANDAQNGRRLYGRNTTAKTGGIALREAGLGTNLPFGEVARVCIVAKRDLGTRVERSEPRKSGYALYDSAPNSSKPRSFYVTGFSDSCVRQFTASLAVFGTPTFHEQLRYGLPAEEYPYSTTDRAYEKVKARLCNVGRNKPCGARISRLEASTAFVSVYEHFGENARWADMLLHDGALLATAVKTP